MQKCRPRLGFIILFILFFDKTINTVLPLTCPDAGKGKESDLPIETGPYALCFTGDVHQQGFPFHSRVMDPKAKSTMVLP